MSSKYKTRDEILRNNLSSVLKNSTSINDVVDIIKNYENSNLKTIEKLTRGKRLDARKIQGALKQTINSHGPITMDFIGSATKRIYGAMLSEENTPAIKKESNVVLNSKNLNLVLTFVIGMIIGGIMVLIT